MSVVLKMTPKRTRALLKKKNKMLEAIGETIKDEIHDRTHIHLDKYEIDEDNLHKVGLNTVKKVCEHHGDRKKLTKKIMKKMESID